MRFYNDQSKKQKHKSDVANDYVLQQFNHLVGTDSLLHRLSRILNGLCKFGVGPTQLPDKHKVLHQFKLFSALKRSIFWLELEFS